MFKAWRTSSSSTRLFGRFSHGELDSDESELLPSDIVRLKEGGVVSIYKKCRLPEKLLNNQSGALEYTSIRYACQPQSSIR